MAAGALPTLVPRGQHRAQSVYECSGKIHSQLCLRHQGLLLNPSQIPGGLNANATAQQKGFYTRKLFSEEYFLK